MIIVEIGTHFTPELINLLEDPSTIGFFVEPLHTHLTKLEEKLWAFPQERYKIIACAVSDRSGMQEFFYSGPDDTAANLFNLENFPFAVTVSTFTLDQIFQYHKIDSIDILRMDIEGSEFDVMQAFSFDVRPKVLLIEPHPVVEKPVDRLRKIIQPHGYTYIADSKKHLDFIGIELDSDVRHSDLLFKDSRI